MTSGTEYLSMNVSHCTQLAKLLCSKEAILASNPLSVTVTLDRREKQTNVLYSKPSYSDFTAHFTHYTMQSMHLANNLVIISVATLIASSCSTSAYNVFNSCLRLFNNSLQLRLLV